MTDTQMYSFMQDFFERYYREGGGIALLRPLEEADRAMWREDADPDEEWKPWKLIPSTVTDQDIEKLEADIGVKLPRCLRAFLTVYHHYFDGPVGVNPISSPFEAVRNAWNLLLVKHGYLPFTWDSDGYYIRCMDLANMPDEERCGICQIDHEILFSMEEDTVQKEEIAQNMEYLSQNLFTYLESILDNGELS